MQYLRIRRTPEQIPLVARVLRPGGEWRLATDDPTYQAWVAEVMGAQSYFDAPAPTRLRPEGWPPTRYETKALAAGREPLYWRFTRRPPPFADVPPAGP